MNNFLILLNNYRISRNKNDNFLSQGGLSLRKKYILMGIGILLILVFIYLRNIIFAIVLHSENIDRHTLGVMLQGRIAPAKELNLIINGSLYNIPLPNGSGKLYKNEYLVPTSSWKGYRDNLNKTEWNYFDQIGTLIRVQNKLGDEFDISIKPFTAAYQLLKYSSKGK
jgi:hypothetical protein